MARKAGDNYAAGGTEGFDLVAPKPSVTEQAGKEKQGFMLIHARGLAPAQSLGPGQLGAKLQKSLIPAWYRRIGGALAVRRAGSAGPGMRAPPGLGLSRTHRQAPANRA